MTTLIAWTGVDSRGPASIYLAADSRFSWTNGMTWQYGRKVYGSRLVAELLGYCGDVLFATQVLSQALEQIEARLLFPESADSAARLAALEEFSRQAFETYPATERRAFCVLYVARNGDGMQSRFSVGEVAWAPATGWTKQVLVVPQQSDVIVTRGSGASTFQSTRTRWAKSDVGGTSRAVFSAFCDHVASGTDPSTGGAPQLVGLYRKGPAVTFGMVWKGRRFLSGAEVVGVLNPSALEWRDELFQRCDPLTLNVVEAGQRHARPAGI
jgi:hypothetical protein